MIIWLNYKFLLLRENFAESYEEVYVPGESFAESYKEPYVYAGY